MSVSIMAKVFYTPYPDLAYIEKSGNKVTVNPVTLKIVMLAISDSSDDFGENSWNSFDRLALKTSLSRRSVIRAIRALKQYGYLSLNGTTVYGTNNFKINLDKLGNIPEKRATAGRPKDDTPIYASDSRAETSDSGAKTSDVASPDSSFNHPKTSSRTSESYKKDIEKSVNIGMTNGGGLSDYPEEIREVLLEFINLWKMKLPRGSQKGYWIVGGRDLLDACGELGVSVIREVRKDFEAYMKAHKGIAPYTVSSPNSLVNPVRAKAGWMRNWPNGFQQPVIPDGASEVWIGGVCYK